MRSLRLSTILLSMLILTDGATGQAHRIPYNNQQLFLSGANLAWIYFAADVGYVPPDLTTFADIMLQMHDHGGNALRWWLHTNGLTTPVFNSAGRVKGPGTNTIQDMKNILDLAWHREISMDICLWSFDMLNLANDSVMLKRNYRILTDSASTQAYISNCLIPMIDSLKGHPAIGAWEIFNEPEGMSNEFGWSTTQHVPMAAIQRFVNLCAGAIHKEDPKALVTCGAWAFYSCTDAPAVILAKNGASLPGVNTLDKRDVEKRFAQKYGFTLPADEIFRHYQQAASQPAYNYYRDDRLISSGGDTMGTLDYYSVHYYDWGGTDISPFHHASEYWQLTKPIVIGEFALQNTLGVPKEKLYDTLYQTGYAGALPWAWTSTYYSSTQDMLASMQYMWDHHKIDVDVNGIGGYWPIISLTAPVTDTTFVDTSQVIIKAVASDADGFVARVEFFTEDSLKIGEVTLPPYTYVWKHPPQGMHVLTAVATDNQGNQRTSNFVVITVGIPTQVRLEAEKALFKGDDGMAVVKDSTASAGAYLDLPVQNGTVDWKISGVPSAGQYELAIGFEVAYKTPKYQYINVNGKRSTMVIFNALSTSRWFEQKFTVDLNAGDNIVQMQLFWGWMRIDYLAVPKVFFPTSVSGAGTAPFTFSLQQNYPNPFNPTTTVKYSLAEKSLVTITLFDILGRTVATFNEGEKPAGNFSTLLDGSHIATGVYFYRMTAIHGQSSFTDTKRLLLVK